MVTRRWPNFLIIGAPRCSTTTLYHAVRQHPDIYMSPVKEPMYFDLQAGERYRGPGDTPGISDARDYLNLFDGADGETVVGEASTYYLSSSRAPAAVHDQVPNAKLLAILRDPVERTLSHWALHLWEGRENLDLRDALAAEFHRERAGWSPGWSYSRLGRYGAQLERYFALFATGQIRVVLYEDLAQDYVRQLREIWHFLGVQPDFQPRLPTWRNSAGVPRSRLLQRLLVEDEHPVRRAVRPVLRLMHGRTPEKLFERLESRAFRRPSLPCDVRASLIEYFHNDVAHCEHLIGRDLSSWLRPE